ncbi:hypothetical protein DRE_02920 [Drechslerella stenobrocha 248]|uniref:Killer toxin Kp4 domain-containing protein n=1 Tax=Drechslerella stenobrocha 248 TaxID=1043628 RepID=W7IF64_9PEZI|nr:hypothetical protein DRE_02920 [Drechslerella stenobrocha 248]
MFASAPICVALLLLSATSARAPGLRESHPEVRGAAVTRAQVNVAPSAAAPDTPQNQVSTPYEPETSHAKRRFPFLSPPPGINCQGLYSCSINKDKERRLSGELAAIIQHIPDSRFFLHKQVIACVRGIDFINGELGFLCAWFDFAMFQWNHFYHERPHLINGKNLKALVQALLDHDCDVSL